jgi:DNA-binding SARP family transcriptional activator
VEAAPSEELRESAREDLVDAELALGRHHDVVGELEVTAASHPLRERRWGQLLLARYRDGRQAEALDGFTSCGTRFVFLAARDPCGHPGSPGGP